MGLCSFGDQMESCLSESNRKDSVWASWGSQRLDGGWRLFIGIMGFRALRTLYSPGLRS